jgi:hypothetical protein
MQNLRERLFNRTAAAGGLLPAPLQIQMYPHNDADYMNRPGAFQERCQRNPLWRTGFAVTDR